MSFGGLYTSISGLRSSQISLNTVGHNISNANNQNYVRQSAIHTNTNYRKIGGTFEQGTGVKVIQIRQIRDEFLDKQIRRELPSFGYFYAKADTLQDVEGVFNEITNSGLQNVMKDFWRGWDELGKEPDSLVNRELVHESAVGFTNTVNHISKQLSDIQINLNKQVVSKVDEANNLLDRIAHLNKAVKAVEGETNKMRANDIRDERNAAIDRLTELLPVTTVENALGETIVSLQGKDLVNGSHVSKIGIGTDDNQNNGFSHIFWENSNEKIELGEKGEIAGIIDVRDGSVVEYQERLDELVGRMADRINEVHRDGYGLGQKPGVPGEPNPNGINFFESAGGGPITAANIKVNPELSNLNKIAASASGEIGDSEIAKKILEIRNNLKIPKSGDKSENPKELTIDGFYNDLVTSLALEREASISNVENQGFLINSIDQKRMGLSSVSLEEEMTDMVKFQHAYSANSRVINTLDEMIDTIVNRLGIVGR